MPTAPHTAADCDPPATGRPRPSPAATVPPHREPHRSGACSDAGAAHCHCRRAFALPKCVQTRPRAGRRAAAALP
eukprot:4705416-Prymnesium_polylepis.1